MKTVAEVLEKAGSKPISFETILEETGLMEQEVEERLARMKSRGDAIEVKPGWWLELR